MAILNINKLTLSWSVSRGQDTYGYNICRLDSRDSGTRYKCTGGGYDMVGTVFGNWLAAEHQETLKAWATTQERKDCDYGIAGYKSLPAWYGLTINPQGKITLDGACGIDCMVCIAEAIGLEVQRDYVAKGRNRGQTTGWFVCKAEENK